MPDRFVTTHWLADHLGDPSIAILDGTWHLPPTGRSASAEFLAAHIPGAAFFDIDVIRDTASALPHMMPSPDVFAQHMQRLGVGDGQRVVVYDQLGLFTAARVRMMLIAFGVADVAILEGGLPRWISEGRRTDAGPAPARQASFTPKPDLSRIADLAAVRMALDTGSAQVVDARPANRFKGEAPEPRTGVASGHMPGSLNLPFTDLVTDGALKDAAALEAAFAQAGVDPDRPVIASCGSGVSAAIIALALEETGRDATAIYDGSWAEWGSRADLPVATG